VNFHLFASFNLFASLTSARPPQNKIRKQRFLQLNYATWEWTMQFVIFKFRFSWLGRVPAYEMWQVRKQAEEKDDPCNFIS
jgi:hypothetical protein